MSTIPHDDSQSPTGDPVRRPKRLATQPPYRRLRAFAFDPLLSNQMDTSGINQVTLSVPWEEGLQPGPVGEYLEVIDIDPPGKCIYEPVDLDHPHLLATDGLSPSEANPAFHQQMVYAVGMATVHNFELALGRKALWAPLGDRDDPKQQEYIQRLRVYPHSLRDANAYYSPDKKALLFGYFPAALANPGRNLPGGMVFSCLSHDIVAHETTHALLDGLHQPFIEPSNPDVPAFHEAFADIVALFQHFTYQDVLKSQIARTQGDLTKQSLLGELAQQFGEATGRNGALRSALGKVNEKTGKWESLPPDPTAILRAYEPHDRGAILVAAVFDAFLSIYKQRVADLLRIATGGSGILPEGALHPDLVNRLAREAAKSAQHVLHMCIRALDYCPPVDLTFGEYLRALITADTELVPNDDLGYRVAITESFRRYGLYPPHVRSLSAESLVWQGSESLADRAINSQAFADYHVDLLEHLNQWDLSADRQQVFERTRATCQRLRGWFEKFRENMPTEDLTAVTGLALGRDAPGSIPRDAKGWPQFTLASARPARCVGPDEQVVVRFVVELTQSRRGFRDPERQQQADAGHLQENVPADFYFRGGCTLVYDLDTAVPRYFIVKNILSDRRLGRQRDFLANPQSLSLYRTYFGGSGSPMSGTAALGCSHGLSNEPFALLHRGF